MDCNKLSILQWNARSIVANKGSLEQYLSNSNIQILAISETWLKPERDFKIYNYNIIRDDRKDGKGGALLGFRKDIKFNRFVLGKVAKDVQICAARVFLSNNYEISIVSGYNKPNNFITYEEWLKILEPISPPILFLGDYNSHSQEWGCVFQDKQGEAIVALCDELDLVPLNDGSNTRLTFGGNPSVVDISFISANNFLNFQWKVEADTLGSDHFPVIITKYHSMPASSNLNFFPRFKTKEANWKVYRELIKGKMSDAPWRESIDVKYEFLVEVITQAALIAIPQTKPYKGTRTPKCWWNEACKEVVDDRKQAHEIYKNNPTLDNFLNLKKAIALSKKVIKEAKRQSWREFCDSINPKTNAKVIWDKMRVLSGTKKSSSYIPSAKVVEEFINKLAPPYVPKNPHPHPLVVDNQDILGTPFSLFEMERALSYIRDSAPGLDQINYSMIRNLPIEALDFMLSIFNEIRYLHFIPSGWKNQLIIPILKPSKNQHEGSSYRPIALSSCILKSFEKLIKFRLDHFLEYNYKLPQFSFGFRAHYGTMDNLSVLVCDIQNSFADRECLLAAFLDIESAYDNVDLQILYDKLIQLGIGYNSAKLIYQLFWEKNIFVKSEQGYISRTVSKGLAQGSILSPLLFNCYTCDIGSCINSECKILQYADDLTIYSAHKNFEHCAESLRMSLVSLSRHLEGINLSISSTKSTVCNFTRKRAILPNNFNIDRNMCFPILAKVKYLGIIMDSKLLWKAHIWSLREKLLKSLSILRVVASRSWGAHPRSLLQIYQALIRSRLDYGNFLFGSASNTTLQILDRIQYQAIRICMGYLKSSPTNAILVEANELPLDLRTELMAQKFLLKRKYRFYHPTIEVISGLENKFYNSSFWTKAKIPPLILASINNRKLNIEPKKSSLAPIYTVPLSTLNSRLNIQLEAKSQTELKYDLTLFTDGSKFPNSTGCAAYDPQSTNFILFKLKKEFSVFSAELIAIREAIRYAINTPYKTIVIFSDSKSALLSIQSFHSKNTVGQIEAEIVILIEKATIKGQRISLAWIKGHSNISGNEMADYLAKRAANFGSPLSECPPWRDIVTLVKENIRKRWALNWSYTSLTRGSFLFKNKPFPSEPWFNRHRNLNRQEIVTFNRLRIGHTLCNAHLNRFAIVPSAQCSCSLSLATPEHLIFSCPLLKTHRSPFIAAVRPNFRDPPSYNQFLKHANETTIQAVHKFSIASKLKI